MGQNLLESLAFPLMLFGLLAVMWGMAKLIPRQSGSSGGSGGRATSLFFLYALIYCSFRFEPWSFCLIWSLISCGCALEITKGANPNNRAGMQLAAAYGFAMIWLAVWATTIWLVVASWLYLLVSLWQIMVAREKERPPHQLASPLLTGLVVAGLCAFALLLAREQGWALGLFAFFLINAVDSFAYLGGRIWGRRKLIPRVSPGKTWEGAWTGLVAGVLVAFLMNWILHLGFSPGEVLAYALILAVLAQFGDLVASLIKREYGIKDFGATIPGHGGIYDRFDSCVFAAPAFLLLLQLSR